MSSAQQTTVSSVDEPGEIVAGLKGGPQSTDLEARQRDALLTFGRRAGANPGKSILLSDAAALLATTFESDFSSAGEIAADGTTLMLKVTRTTKDGQPHDSAVYKMSLHAADSMAGTALETAQPVVAENLPLQKQFADIALRKLRVVSGLTVPLHVDNRPFGVLGIYTTSERNFTKNDVCFAETIAHQLMNSIARAQSQEQLQDYQHLTSTILQSVDSLVIELDAEFKLISLNRACRNVTGFVLREVADKAFSSVFVVPEELDLVQGTLRRSAADKSSRKFETSIITKDGERRRIAWSLSVICRDEGSLQSILLTGTDRTELIETELRLNKAEALARQSVTRLQELRQEMGEQTIASNRPVPTSGEAPDAAPDDVSRATRTQTQPETRTKTQTHTRTKTQTEMPTETPSEAPGKIPSDASCAKTSSEADTTPQSVMIQRPNGVVGRETRTNARRSFNYKQLIAPIYEGVMPSREEFFQVTCENISAGGFAFYVEDEPDFEYLVVALGQEPILTFFSARVTRVMYKEHEGSNLYLVGCRFSGRVRP